MEESLNDKISNLFQLLSHQCGLPEMISDSYKIEGPNLIICKKCGHSMSFQQESDVVIAEIDLEDPEDLIEHANEHVKIKHGEKILKEYLKNQDGLLVSEKPIAENYLAEKITLEQFADKMIENSKIVSV